METNAIEHTGVEPVSKRPWRVRAYKVIRKLLLGFILATMVNFVFSYFFHTPKVYSLGHRNTELLMQYRMLQDKIDAASSKLREIENRNNGIYRSIFGLDTVQAPPSTDPLDYVDSELFSHNRYGSLMSYAGGSLNLLTERLYLQSISLDTLQVMAVDKEHMTEAIPAIWPLDRKMIRNIGMFGYRIHPIFKTRKMHQGTDFSGAVNTPIYATADGVVAKSCVEGGYGNSVVINHGYGYQTRYAHLNKSLVKVGQRVHRGEKIALMGNTGRSTGPHLHYEVIYRGVRVNPLSYLSRDMTDADFKRIIESAKNVIYEEYEREWENKTPAFGGSDA
ncbi:MAG: M23 family metallopeptidase [Rikenellaceae bacterium]|nr:M23 family metallopeptidase [Rikenellaceae bacterium]